METSFSYDRSILAQRHISVGWHTICITVPYLGHQGSVNAARKARIKWFVPNHLNECKIALTE